MDTRPPKPQPPAENVWSAETKVSMGLSLARYQLRHQRVEVARRALLGVVRALRAEAEDEDRVQRERVGPELDALVPCGAVTNPPDTWKLGDDEVRLFGGVQESFGSLPELETAIQTADASTLRVILLAMSAMASRVGILKLSIWQTKRQAGGRRGAEVTRANAKERHNEEWVRFQAQRVLRAHPKMLAHDVATQIFTDAILPQLSPEQAQDRESCDGLVLWIREVVSASST
jgi:hypothetical protein